VTKKKKKIKTNKPGGNRLARKRAMGRKPLSHEKWITLPFHPSHGARIKCM
jgi:hypothetical protein